MSGCRSTVRALEEPEMPWSVLREGQEIHIRITPPVGDWRLLIDRVHDEIRWNTHRTKVATLPSELPGASAFELAILEVLREMLSEAGVTVRRSRATEG
jgi:hypothetical protein